MGRMHIAPERKLLDHNFQREFIYFAALSATEQHQKQKWSVLPTNVTTAIRKVFTLAEALFVCG